MGEAEVTAFLTWLAVRRKVSASTQNQALSALVFLYRDVLKQELPWLDDLVRAKRSRRLPIVLTRREVGDILDNLHGVEKLVVSLLYGSGLRLLEALRLRIKDIDFERREILIRDAKGKKDRVTMLPAGLIPELRNHLENVRRQHERDLRNGNGSVHLPDALAAKYPRAAWEVPWQWVFPATRFYRDPETGLRRRHHLHESVVQRAVRLAVRVARIPKPATCPTPCATPSPPICSTAAPSCAMSRSSWATPTSPPPRSTPR
jgi:integron integrase